MPDPADPEEYDKRIADVGGIDLFLLASGTSDGHVAFNPAGTPVGTRTRVVGLTEQTRRDNLTTFPTFGGLDEVPLYGVTVGGRFELYGGNRHSLDGYIAELMIFGSLLDTTSRDAVESYLYQKWFVPPRGTVMIIR